MKLAASKKVCSSIATRVQFTIDLGRSRRLTKSQQISTHEDTGPAHIQMKLNHTLFRPMALVAIWIVGLTSAAFVPITTRICAPTPPLIGAPGATRFSAPTQSSIGDETQSQHVPATVFALNAATKWLVVAAQTTAVVTRRDLVSPYIVIGSIVASFGTATLKRLIGQQRPAGSPFTDPGMPSSHALVGTFAAVGWAVHLRAPLATFWLLLSAAVIALLRVAAGYHTWAQVIVGSTLGATTACAWMAAGAGLAPRIPRPAALRVVYAIYVLGSALFIGSKMATWPGSERRRTRGGAPQGAPVE